MRKPYNTPEETIYVDHVFQENRRREIGGETMYEYTTRVIYRLLVMIIFSLNKHSFFLLCCFFL